MPGQPDSLCTARSLHVGYRVFPRKVGIGLAKTAFTGDFVRGGGLGDLILEHFMEQVDAAVSSQKLRGHRCGFGLWQLSRVVDDLDGFPVQVDEIQQVGDR